MPKHTRTLGGLTAVFLVLAGCAALIESSPISAPLSIVEKPLYQSGDTWVWEQNDGTRNTSTISGFKGGFLIAENTGWPDCPLTLNQGMIGPYSGNVNCRQKSWQHKVTERASLFPLGANNTGKWDVEVIKGPPGAGSRWIESCSVIDTARVAVPAGEFDTYKIRCDSRYQTKDWYFAPSINSPVLYNRRTKSNGATRIEKLVSFSPANG